MKKSILVVLFVVLGFSLASAGFFSADVKVARVTAPLHVLSGTKQIGIVNFKGVGGQTLTQKFLNLATMSNRPKGEGGTFGGGVVDIGKGLTSGILGLGAGILGGDNAAKAVTDAVGGKGSPVIEKGLKTNPFDVKQYNDVDAAKAAGAQAIVTCDLSSEGMKSRDYQAKGYRYVNGKKEEYTASCREVSLAVKGTMKVLDSATGNVVFTKELAGSSGNSACDDARSTLPGEQALAEAAVSSMAGPMADQIIPYVEVVKYDLEKDKIVKKGKDLAEDGKFEDAIDQFRIAIKADSLNYAANYDLGIMEEIFGDYENAKKHYNAADKLQTSKESKAALSRIDMRIATVTQLETLGMKLEPYVAAVKGVKVPQFLVKGDNKDRFFLLQEAADGAAQVCQVAGGMKLDYSTKQEGWVKLKCIDGEKEGWIKMESVKMVD